MFRPPIAPSPVAAALLEVAERMADGTIVLGGRRLDVRRGAAIQVSPRNGDGELEDFLAHAGRLTIDQAEAVRYARRLGQPVLGILEELATPKIVRHAVQRLWVERLAKGIAEQEDSGTDPPHFVPAAPAWDGHLEVPLVPLLLEALSRRASSGDADVVGSQPNLLFEWDSSSHRDAAERWSDLASLPTPPLVSLILSRMPGGAPRLAALVRARLAHLRSKDSDIPPPPRRPPSIPPPSAGTKTLPPPVFRPITTVSPPASTAAGTLETRDDSSSVAKTMPPPEGHSVDAELSGAVTVNVSLPESLPPDQRSDTLMDATPLAVTLPEREPSAPHRVPSEPAPVKPPSTVPPPRDPEISLSPGRGAPTRVTGSLPPPSLVHIPLEDPLDPVERYIAMLEQTRASGPERAAAWREAARILESHFGAVSEAARAFREAAAADPEDRVAQREAALRCASLGEFTVARAYAESGVSLAKNDKERVAAWKRVAQLSLWDHDVDECVRALSSACEIDPSDLSLPQRLWSVLVSDGRIDDAVVQSRVAAERLHAVEPARARAMLAWAHDAHPDDVDVATEYALAVAHDGYSDGAVALLARALARLAGTSADAPDCVARAKAAVGELRPAAGTPSRRRSIGRSLRERGFELGMEAFQLEAKGEIPKALEVGKRALESDPDQALALLLSYDHRHDLEAPAKLDVIDGVRRIIGDHVSLLSELARLAKQEKNDELYAEAIDARVPLVPEDAAVALKRLQVRTGEANVESLRQALHDALAINRFDHAHATLDALIRIAELEGDAMQLGIRAVERLGHRDADLVSWVVKESESDSRPQLRVLALEHAFARAAESEKARLLLTLSRHFQSAGQRAAEARTLVRVLGVAPYHPQALERLTELYGECGEAERLMAVLALRLEAAPHPDDRAARLRDLAAAALHLTGDRDRALGFVQDIIDEAGDDPVRLAFGIRALVALHKPLDVVRLLGALAIQRDPKGAGPLWVHAVGIAETEAHDDVLALEVATKGLGHAPQNATLLLAFERLALELRQVETARTIYGALMDRAMGVHGRRAVAYREARWLERAGDVHAALDAYAQAFALAPSAGVVLAAIERLATQLAEWEPLVAACTSLIDQTHDLETRVTFIRQAAELCERELLSTRRAFALYVRGWHETGDNELKEQARRLAKHLAAHSPAEGADAYSAFIGVLRERAEKAWDTEERVAVLLEIGRVYALECGAPDLACEAVDDAVDRSAKDEELAGRRPDMLAELADWLLSRFGRRAEAISRVRRALTIDPEHGRSRELAAQLGLREDTYPPEGRRTSFVPPEPAEPESTHITSLRKSVSEGDLDAALELARALLDAGQPREGHRLMLSVVRRDPSRTEVIRELHALSLQIPVPAAAAITAELLAMFDPSLELRPARVVFPEPGVFTPHDRRLMGRARVLRLVWEHAGALFRIERADLGLEGSDRISPVGRTPLSLAFADSARLLELENEVELYTRRHDYHGVFVACTKPPAAVINVAPRRDDLEDTNALRFRIGRAMELARPEHILLATRSAVDGERLIRAISALSPGATRDPDPTVAALADRLVQLLPASAVEEIGATLAELDTPLDYGSMVVGLSCRAACAGLAVCGRVAPSVRGLTADDPSLQGITVTSEDEYKKACADSKPLRALLRFALSDEYLAAHALSSTFTP